MNIADVCRGDQFQAGSRYPGDPSWIVVERVVGGVIIFKSGGTWTQETLDMAMNQMNYRHKPAYPSTILYPEGV